MVPLRKEEKKVTRGRKGERGRRGERERTERIRRTLNPNQQAFLPTKKKKKKKRHIYALESNDRQGIHFKIRKIAINETLAKTRLSIAVVTLKQLFLIPPKKNKN